MIDELLAVYRLKDEVRAGWLLRHVAAPESVADHSWGTAVLCLLHAEEAGIDIDRAVRIALVHDIAEAEVGDIPRRVNENEQPVSTAEKGERERRAMARLDGGPLDPVVTLWREYEEGASDTARFVRDMNLIDMCLQALFYERDGRRREIPLPPSPEGAARWEALDEFFETARPRLATAVGQRLFADIEARYRALRSGR
jgi:putative hydrolase of HD superfamily